MKVKDLKALCTKGLEELYKNIYQARELLVDLRLDQAQNKLKNTGKISVQKREIAQMLTIAKELERVQSESKKGERA